MYTTNQLLHLKEQLEQSTGPVLIFTIHIKIPDIRNLPSSYNIVWDQKTLLTILIPDITNGYLPDIILFWIKGNFLRS